uniref:Truncated VIM-1 lactamase n=1 Tax=Pseudomonas aeruginosa TaxID=287 RepID=A0A0M4NIA7_PSEAI|nr:truncated VIM-1 lactamase [Pseudomonas aeruginosa]
MPHPPLWSLDVKS